MIVDRLRAGAALRLARRHPAADGEVRLGYRQVYILPTRAGLALAVGCLVLMIGSMNYGLQLGFALTFLVAAVALVAMYHTQRNLMGLSLRCQGAQPVYAGDVLAFELVLVNGAGYARPALHLSPVHPGRRRLATRRREKPPAGVWADVAERGLARVDLPLPTRRRGLHRCPPVRIRSRFPFGLWETWSYFTPAATGLVYPMPEADAPPLPSPGAGARSAAVPGASGDDFAAVRPYQPGDARRLIAWRLAARGRELAVKVFEAPTGGDVLLDYDALPPALEPEARISRLARWVLEAEAAGIRYGLRVPGSELPVDAGATHRHRCLEALALLPTAPTSALPAARRKPR